MDSMTPTVQKKVEQNLPNRGYDDLLFVTSLTVSLFALGIILRDPKAELTYKNSMIVYSCVGGMMAVPYISKDRKFRQSCQAIAALFIPFCAASLPFTKCLGRKFGTVLLVGGCTGTVCFYRNYKKERSTSQS